MFRVIIAGGRDFDDYPRLARAMDALLASKLEQQETIVIVCGKARGADTLGEKYALERGYEVQYYPAMWDVYGRGAGFRRNEEMARNADALVAFWDGDSHGTKHMIDTAKRYGLEVRAFYYRAL